MDYQRIYEAFIASRKARPEPHGYSEIHHILPRSLGGGEEPSNLIRLTPEDHYFAHLLLAKIHGGRMWAAVHAMCHLANESTREHRTRLHARVQFGHVRRSLAEYYRAILSGPDGKISDATPRSLKHLDGREALGNRFELEAQTGVPRQQISAVLRGAKKTAHGWYSPDIHPGGLTKEQLRPGRRCRKVHALYHHDGRSWRGTRHEFKALAGQPLCWGRAGRRSIAGWYRTPEEASRHDEFIRDKARRVAASRGDISGCRNPMAGSDRRKDMLVDLIHQDGRAFKGSLKELADMHGFNASQYRSFRRVLTGKRIVGGFKVKSFHGWRLAGS